MTKPTSEPRAEGAAPSRIIAAEALRGVTAFGLAELQGSGLPSLRRLTTRDLDNETARAAYELGRRRGHDSGLRAGIEQARQDSAQALQDFSTGQAAQCAAALQQAAAAFRAQLAGLEQQLAGQVLQLSVDIARQVLRREVAQDPAVLLPAAREALHALAEGAAQLELRLHPDDAAALAPHLETLGSAGCRLQADAALPRGSCRVEADTGVADAGLATRWRCVIEALGRAPGEAP